MDSSLSRSFQFLFLSLQLLCCFSFADLIHDVCSQTSKPSLCSKALRSDRRSRGADLKLLGQISIDLASASAKSGAALVTKLGKGVTDPRLKGIYDTCLENFENSVDDLLKSTEDLKNGDYLGVNIEATAAETDIDTCDESFLEAGEAEPRKLKAASQNAQDLCNIILVISNLLRG